MRLEKTLKVLRRISSVSDPGLGIDDALLVGDIELVLRFLKAEVARLAVDEMEPRLLLSLSKLYLAIGDEGNSRAMFQRAASFPDQNRGFYTDLGFCAAQLRRDSPSADFSKSIAYATEGLLVICPFREDLQRALGQA